MIQAPAEEVDVGEQPGATWPGDPSYPISVVSDIGWGSELLAPYYDVLTNKEEFVLGNTSATLDGHISRWDEQTGPRIAFRFVGFTVVDLDQDGFPEVVLSKTATPGGSLIVEYLILYIFNGDVIGTIMSHRGFLHPTTKGFFWSGGGGYQSVCTMSFTEGGEVIDTIFDRVTICETFDHPGYYAYYAYGVEVTYEEYVTAANLVDWGEQVIWYEFNDSNVQALFSKDCD